MPALIGGCQLHDNNVVILMTTKYKTYKLAILKQFLNHQ